MKWSWDWVAGYEGYSFGDNPVFDWLRILCVVGGFVLMFAMLRVLRVGRHENIPMGVGQQLRFASLALADLYISATEVAVLGSPGTPRFAVGFISLIAGAAGVWGMREEQRQRRVLNLSKEATDGANA